MFLISNSNNQFVAIWESSINKESVTVIRGKVELSFLSFSLIMFRASFISLFLPSSIYLLFKRLLFAEVFNRLVPSFIKYSVRSKLNKTLESSLRFLSATFEVLLDLRFLVLSGSFYLIVKPKK
jgi:hypothetical protein